MTVQLPHNTNIDRKPNIWAILWDYMTTGDHKKIGILYMATSVVGFAVAGILALMIRVQLAVPNNTFLVGQQYNEVLTLHAVLMLFFFIIPFGLVGFGNYFLPLHLGERDVALPRVNTFGYWLFLFSLVLVIFSLFKGGPASAGWTFYYPISQQGGTGTDSLMIALILNGIASLLGAANFCATILNLRAKGMGVWKMSVFSWSIFATSILQLVALGGLTSAALMTLLERKLGITMFNSDAGGVPVLMQQFFWFYSHPAVYVMLLPYLGVAAEIASTFSKKPLFGYRVMVYSILGITLIGLIVWVHHIFAVSLPDSWQIAFAVATMLVGVPTGAKLFNLIGTMWGGHIVLKAPMYWLIGFIFNFIIGGITGITLGLIPFDYQVTQTYYVVAHFHNVLMFGTAYLVMGGLYYWWPKMTGRMMSEKLGLWHFWLFIIGSWLTFMPQYVLGLLGMPRRYYTYPDGNYLWNELNMLSTVGAFVLGVGGIFWIWNMLSSFAKPKDAGDNPWGGFTLEWATSSPPAAQNFTVKLPNVFPTERPLYDWNKMGLKLEPDHSHVHLPDATVWPFMSAVGLLIMSVGLAFGWDKINPSDVASTWLPWGIATAAVGLVWLVVSLFRWAGTSEYSTPVHHHVLTKYSNGQLGMMWFIVSEVGLFSVLIAGYIYLRLTGHANPPLERPAVWLAAINTMLLVSSSFVLHYAEKHLEQGRATRFTLGLFVTMAMGALFFLFQIFEFVLFGNEVNWTKDIWASCFLTIVGLHGVHIVIGAVGVGLPYYQMLTGKINKHEHGSIIPASLYWHLVDVVWIFIVAIFYIW